MVGIGFDINHIANDILSRIDIINIENPLYPQYLNGNYHADISRFLEKDYGKAVITDGAYIDLNPGTPEPEIRAIVAKKVSQSIAFAASIKSEEIIFLSTFLPMIQMDFYDEIHIEHSIVFWKEMMAKTTGIRVSLCNIFEYDPRVLLRIVEGVGHNRFGLAFDVGHAFAYGKITLKEFFSAVEPFCKSIYLHSNRNYADEHLNIFEGNLLKSPQFREIVPLLQDKNVLLKPFDKTRLHENLDILEALCTRRAVRNRPLTSTQT